MLKVLPHHLPDVVVIVELFKETEILAYDLLHKPLDGERHLTILILVQYLLIALYPNTESEEEI